MKVLFLAAVDFELDVARRAWGDAPAVFHVGGVGAAATRKALESLLRGERWFDRVVNVGIAGSGSPAFPLGSVVHVTNERYGEAPQRVLIQPAPWPELDFLPKASGNTVQVLDAQYRRLSADVETMEGAAFFETCLADGIPFAEIRAVSNRVGETDHARWDIPLALQNLESALRRLKMFLQ